MVRMFDPNKTPMTVVNEIPLKLTRKCLEVLGQSGYDNEINRHPIGKWFINIKLKFLGKVIHPFKMITCTCKFMIPQSGYQISRIIKLNDVCKFL